MLSMLTSVGSAWVRSARDRFRPLGRPLDAAELASVGGYFEPALLERVRIHRATSLMEPPFLSLLRSRGIAVPLDLLRMAGITLDDTIVVAARNPATGGRWQRLLFHELVHVVQFEMLGIDCFVARYLEGWALCGYRYEGIPLEQAARRLEARFAAGDAPFPVREAVQLELGQEEGASGAAP